MKARFSIQKGERLKSRKVIKALFEQGKSLAKYPLRFVWLEKEERQGNSPLQFTVSVSKRNFKRAVDRNRIKRVVREAFRLNKAELLKALEGREQQVALMVIYSGREEFSLEEIESAFRKLTNRLLQKLGSDY